MWSYVVTTNLFLALSRGCQRNAHVACFGYLKGGVLDMVTTVRKLLIL